VFVLLKKLAEGSDKTRTERVYKPHIDTSGDSPFQERRESQKQNKCVSNIHYLRCIINA